MMLFKENFHKKIAALFDGGDLISDAGLLLLRGVDTIIGLIERMSYLLRIWGSIT